MANALEFVLNGRPIRVENISPNTTLLEYLRGNGCTGTKEGCAEGDCGACSVAIVEENSSGKNSFRAVNSCLMPLALVAGRNIVTVEGVANKTGELHAVQRAMVENHGSQCGYCTPGIVMSLFEGFYRDDLKQPWQIDDQLCGNLCRCTGYRPIRDAAIEAFTKKSADYFTKQLEQNFATLDSSEYRNGDEKFFRPTSLSRLFELMAENPDARLVAGATELGLEITKRYRKFSTLISIEAISELKQIESTESEWRIGAAVTLTRLEEKLAAEFSALAKMLAVFGSRQIRNRATLGGNLVNASPIGDSAPVLMALNAKVILASSKGERTLPLQDFFVGYRKTALRSGEILKTILLPRTKIDSQNTLCNFYKVSKRREMDISTVAACFRVELDDANLVRNARLVFGGVAATTVRAKTTEDALLGKTWSAETLSEILPILAGEFAPISDVRGSAEYRRNLITSLFEKFYFESVEHFTTEKADIAILSSECRLHADPHESGHKHVTGEAIYTDDHSSRKRALEVWPVCSPHARAKILKRDISVAQSMPGIRTILLAEDVPGLNDIGAVKHDEILLADKEVFFHGQIIALVVGESFDACRAAAEKVVIEYEPLPAILTIEEALEKNSFHNEPNFMRRGDVETALRNSPMQIEGEFSFGGQEHFYLEMQAAFAEPGEDGSVSIVSSTQHPSEVQATVAHVLNIACNKVVVQCPRMGGGFGGKETQAATPAALAALAATKTGLPVRIRYNRDQDMMLTGKRHPFLTKFEVGFNADGKLLATRAEIFSNGGWSLDLSQAVTDRALFHFDNCYYIPNVEISGRVAKTNLASNTAFRGFGGPQGMLIIEEIIARIAHRLGVAPEMIREKNLYHGSGETNTTHYGQEIEDNRIQAIWNELKHSAELTARREQIKIWNARHPHRKRGIAMTPVKFGISFTVTHMNQAGALVLLYPDGTAQVNHGGTEMGQGIHTNITEIASRALGLNRKKIRVMHTSTDKVPNTSATAASSGTDLNGAAVKNACDILRQRLVPVAIQCLQGKFGQVSQSENLIFNNDTVFDRNCATNKIAICDVFRAAYSLRISLSASGFYRTPDIHWDRDAGRGKPFHYFANGAAVSEVEIDGFTGMMQVLRADILQDVGDSLNEDVNRGQIEGGFVQGMGWLTSEELKWNDKGVLLTHSPDTYKIPAIGDAPKIFNVNFLKNAAQKNVVHGTKAVGEPPFMLAISVREAIRDAIAAFGSENSEIELPSPATCEAIFTAIQKLAFSSHK